MSWAHVVFVTYTTPITDDTRVTLLVFVPMSQSSVACHYETTVTTLTCLTCFLNFFQKNRDRKRKLLQTKLLLKDIK